MTIFLRLLLAHLLADFLLLKDKAFELKKEKSLKSCALRGAVFLLCASALCSDYLGTAWARTGPYEISGCQMLFALAVLRFAVGWLDKSDLSASCGYHTLFFAVWEAVNISALFLAAPVFPAGLMPENSSAGAFFAVASGALLVTYFLTILIYYIDLDTRPDCGPLLPDEIYFSMLFRLVLYLLLLVPAYYGWFLGAAWVGFIIFSKGMTVFDVSKPRVVIGVPLTVLIALTVRLGFLYAY
jgi:hypothetical protein